MCDVRKIEKLQEAILDLCDTDTSFLELDRDEQRLIELAQALNTRAELVKRRKLGEGGQERRDEREDQLTDLLSRLTMAQELGVLGDVLSPKNRDLLSQVLGGVVKAANSPLEEALRKRDQANYLRDSSDTDLLLEKQKQLDDLVAKKDR